MTSHWLTPTCETHVTFTFTFLVGAFLLAGGVYLIYDGTQNNVVDFVVLGGCGIFMGICSSTVGSFILFRAVYYSSQDRNRKQEERCRCLNSEKVQISYPTPYIIDTEEKLFTRQASDQRIKHQETRPHSGNPSATPGRHSSSSKYSKHQALSHSVLPNTHVNFDEQDQSVVLLNWTKDHVFDVSETAGKRDSPSDRTAIKSSRKPRINNGRKPLQKQSRLPKKIPKSTPVNIISGQAMSDSANVVSQDLAAVSMTDLLVHAGDTGSHAASINLRLSPHEQDGSPLPDIDATIAKAHNLIEKDIDNRPDKFVNDIASDEDSSAQKKRVLSVLHEWKYAGQLRNGPHEDSQDGTDIEMTTLKNPFPRNDFAIVNKLRPGQFNVEVIVHNTDR